MSDKDRKALIQVTRQEEKALANYVDVRDRLFCCLDWWGNREVVKERELQMPTEKKYWIALNGPSCAISRTPWMQPVTIPVAQQYLGFPTLEEAERAQDICLHQPDAEVQRFLESLSPDVQSGRIRVIEPPSPQPPTKGAPWWLESADAPRLIEPRN
jgi:hypothetical protein